MKKLVLALTAVVALAACSSENKTANKENTEVHTSVGNYDSYGALISPDSAIDASTLVAEMGNSPSYEAKIKGKVIDVCSKKGCWMMVDIGNGEQMRIVFRDYAFFVPTDKDKIVGKEVIMEGVATFETISIDDQKHYAQDAGESKEEIAKITEPKNVLGFEAIGVLVPKSEADANATASAR